MMESILYTGAGKKGLQRLFEVLLSISLRGMNYGNGGDFEESGELNVLKYVKEKFKAEKLLVIFDVGGNVGNYSKALSEFFGQKAIIHAFEPSKATYDIFLKNTKGSENVIPNNCGLSDTENSLLLYTDAEHSGLASVYQRNLEHFGLEMDKSEEIKLSTLDVYCSANKIDRIHFLKLDIEGHELKALNGAKRMIDSKNIDIIQFEFGGANIDSRTYFQDFFYLLKDNYSIYRIVKDGLFEMPIYKETYEVFLTINYLAVRK